MSTKQTNKTYFISFLIGHIGRSVQMLEVKNGKLTILLVHGFRNLKLYEFHNV